MTHIERFDTDGLMTFGQAMIMLMQGHIISRFVLNYPFYFQLADFTEANKVFNIPCTFHKYKGDFAPAIFQDNDLTAKDWIIYKPNQPL